jgi:prevent-host-death family protein
MVMSGSPVKKRRARPGGRQPEARLAAAVFKAQCLQLMDRVRETGEEFVVTKHGKPVAKLVPYTEPKKRPFFGFMRGTVLSYERPFDPIDAEWDINLD